MKKILIIPGFGESTNETPYAELKKILGKKYIIETHNPQWDYRTASRWISDLQKKLPVDNSNTTVIAFSFGAYITFVLSETISFERIILCSLSPFFKEQIKNMPKEAKAFFGKRRVADFNNHSIPSKIKPKSVFLFGDKDWDFAIQQAKNISKNLHSRFVLVKDSPHELTPKYIKEILNLV